MKKIVLITGVFLILFSLEGKTPIFAIGQLCAKCNPGYILDLPKKLCCKIGDPICSLNQPFLNNCSAVEVCSNPDGLNGLCIAGPATPTPRATPTPNLLTPPVANTTIIPFDDLNKAIGLTNPELQTLGGIISSLFPSIFTLSSIILFILLLFSGFEFLTSAGDEKKLQQAKGRITSALVGFIIIVAAYWLTQIVEFLFHIEIF